METIHESVQRLSDRFAPDVANLLPEAVRVLRAQWAQRWTYAYPQVFLHCGRRYPILVLPIACTQCGLVFHGASLPKEQPCAL